MCCHWRSDGIGGVKMANEKRLIDANALRNQVMNEIRHYWNCGEGGYYLAEDVIPDIDNAPTVDAVEVVHGRWRVSRASEISKTVWCTACGEEIYIHKNDTLKIDRMPYCPNCGAKMDGDGNG